MVVLVFLFSSKQLSSHKSSMEPTLRFLRRIRFSDLVVVSVDVATVSEWTLECEFCCFGGLLLFSTSVVMLLFFTLSLVVGDNGFFPQSTMFSLFTLPLSAFVISFCVNRANFGTSVAFFSSFFSSLYTDRVIGAFAPLLIGETGCTVSVDFRFLETFSEFSLQIPLHFEHNTCLGRNLTVILLFLYLLDTCTFFFFVLLGSV